jgi:protein phosphatase 2C family protein 2/3
MLDKSGSCAICTLFVDEDCYIINVGDSRAILSADGGNYFANLSEDHKPQCPKEQGRINEAGGKIY